MRREVRRRTPVRAVPDLCAYRDEAMVRCLHTAEIGGFCFVHDELIHQLGGDNHPATRDIFARSTLGTTRPPVERGEES